VRAKETRGCARGDGLRRAAPQGAADHGKAVIDPFVPLCAMQERWTARRNELAALCASVPGATLCELVLADIATLMTQLGGQRLTLTEAARWSGYSREHLGRLVAKGTIPNAGRPNAPRIRVADLPRKTGHLPPPQTDSQIAGTSKRQIVRSIASLPDGGSR